jgi:uncharacterized protein (TIGR01777 family)
MNIAIAGSNGFIGSLLTTYFTEIKYNVKTIKRTDYQDRTKLLTLLSQSDVVINLAGANISNRWTNSYKNELLNSRINTTKVIVECLNSIDNKQIKLINASAIGIYSNKLVNTEVDFDYGSDYLANIVVQWENEVSKLVSGNYVIARLGLVIDRRGGLLQKLLMSNKFRVLPYFGSKSENLNFIDSVDLVEVFNYFVHSNSIGVYNIVSPESTSIYKVNRLLSNFNKTSFVFCLPDFILKAIFGNGFYILKGTPKAYPKRLLDEGFQFKYKTIHESIKFNLFKL